MSKSTAARILTGLLLLIAPAAAQAQKAIFVVRHAEKTADDAALLTETGRARAQRLAAMLKDSGIAAIYSTDTARTRDTVRPLADVLGLKVELYDTGASMSGKVDARAFAASLRKAHPNDVVLIVGHSNTIPNLLETLGCPERVTLADGEYDNLFVVVPKAGGATLVRVRY